MGHEELLCQDILDVRTVIAYVGRPNFQKVSAFTPLSLLLITQYKLCTVSLLPNFQKKI